MKIPIFEEIIFSNFETESILDKLNDTKIGRVPTYINIFSLKKEEKSNLIVELKNAFLSLNINPRFPYPCYLITEKLSDNYFPQALSVKELPDHFFKKVKRPNNKEMQLLNKLALKVEKINNLDMNNIIEDVNDTSPSQKKLYTNTKEIYFLELLHYKLFEFNKERGKHGKKI